MLPDLEGEKLPPIWQLLQGQLRDGVLEPCPTHRLNVRATSPARSNEPDSPRGVWETSDAGRAYLCERLERHF